MRRGLGQFLRIDVSRHAVSVQRVSRWRGLIRASAGAGAGAGAGAADTLGTRPIAPAGQHSADAIAAAVRALLGELNVAGWPVSVVLADELARLWRVTPPPGAERMADLEAAASLRFHALYGDAAADWQISADWCATRPFFAAAVPRALLTALRGVAQDCKLSIVAIEPRFISAWNRSRRGLKRGAWFGHVHEQLLTLAIPDADCKGLRAIRPLAIPPGAGHDWLTQMLQREALLLEVDAPPLLQLNGGVPAGWTAPAGSAAHIPCAALAERLA